MKNQILGNISVEQFFRDYWQKKPLVIRKAFHNFNGFLNKEQLISLSSREEAQSRLISHHRKQWTLTEGPFAKQHFTKLMGKWTLLVQDINHFFPEAAQLLKNFNFLPHARLDDLMISYATDGSGVGPHFDSYDVFLLQGAGKRLWQVAKQHDQKFLPNMPLKILKNFRPEHEWLLLPGDMLYLPPNYAHNGIAVGECMTYSIGFRAPSHQEIVDEFLIYLQDHIKFEGIYSDPDIKVAKHPAQISDAMINKISALMKKISYGKEEIKDFLGTYLSEPKKNIFFSPPTPPLRKNQFLKQAKQKGICLDLKSQMLFTDKLLFINGEALPFLSLMKPLLIKLADEREITISKPINEQTSDLIYKWYLYGYLTIRNNS